MTAGVQDRSVIPVGAKVTAGVVAVLAFIGVSFAVNHESSMDDAGRMILPVVAAVVIIGYVLLIGYIYGDARRRGMRYVLWTLLAVLAPSAIGILLYFILRDPRQVHCTKCGCSMNPNFAYCPRCGGTMSATCGQCHRVAQPEWSHCAWCGGKL